MVLRPKTVSAPPISRVSSVGLSCTRGQMHRKLPKRLLSPLDVRANMARICGQILDHPQLLASRWICSSRAASPRRRVGDSRRSKSMSAQASMIRDNRSWGAGWDRNISNSFCPLSAGGGRMLFNGAAPLIDPSCKAGVRNETVRSDLGRRLQRAGAASAKSREAA
jgi:hypothetical protein